VIGDSIDSRYHHPVSDTENDSFTAVTYFPALNEFQANGTYFFSTEPLYINTTYSFDAITRSVARVADVAYDKLVPGEDKDDKCLTDLGTSKFIQNMPYMSHCSVDVSCELIEDFQDGNSAISTLNIYRIASTAKCDAGRFSTERTIYVDAKTF
jgi:hypothetical protein